jgi:hypothetical protein
VTEIEMFFNGLAKAVAAMQGTIIMTPSHWPKRHDVISGPCICGAWHSLDEAWVLEGFKRFGMKEASPNK